MAEEKYDESDIKTLSEIEHIRQNADMYIGVTDTPNHLLYEVLDNALDEANAGHAKLILVSIDNENSVVTIADNGRGIPYKNNTLVNLATKLFTGGKFEKGEKSKAYKAAIGLHGIGLVAVTALSDWVEIIVYRDNKKVYYRFEDCKVVKHTEEDFDSSKRPCSTCIKFKPSSKYFESLQFNTKPIVTRLQLASVHIKDLSLIYILNGHKEVIKMNMEQYFESNFFNGTDKKNQTPIFEVSHKIKDEELYIRFAWDMNTYSQPISGGSVNLLPVSAGTHVNMTYLTLQSIFERIAKKEKLNFNPMDYKIGLRVYTSVQLYKPHYDGQTKHLLSNRKNELQPLYDVIEKKIEAELKKDETLYNKIVYFIDSYRKSLTTKKTIIKNSGPVTRYNCSIDSKLKDCTSTDVSLCELYITEGDSASGGLVQCRNPKYHAILGLRGKVPNIADPKIDYLKNKEFVEIINSAGTGCGRNFDIQSLRYDKIIIATDADADGAHICVLLIIAFLRMFPELIKQGKVYRAILPLYGVEFEGNFIPFYTEDDKNIFAAQHPNVQISRYKGLGEMMPKQLKECLLNPNVRKLQQIKSEEDFDAIFKLMIDVESKRDLILEDSND